MFLVIFVLLALATVPLAGGRLSRLADLRLRAVPVVFVALAVQVVIISLIGGGPDWLHPALHLSTYAVTLWFVWVNRSVPGAWLLGAGGLCNFVAIAVNGGTMPASRGAIEAAGVAHGSQVFANSGVVEHARLAFLGDVFAIPASWPVHNVFSIGDVLIALGALVLVHTVCGSRLVRLRPGSGWQAAHPEVND
jgi:Family of unknown function (DUF5317)